MTEAAPTELSDLERLRKQYAEMAQLAGALAHEIRNPLSTINMNLDLVAEELPENESAQSRRLHQKIEIIQRECRQLENILNAYLQFVRVGELELEPADLNEVVKRFLDFFKPQAETANVELSFHLAPGLPQIPLDASLIRQVLQNLTRNSLDAMPDGGVIEFQTRCDNGDVVLEVIDNGEGIPQETCEKIFDAFYSRKTGGSGLGLSTVRKIVEAHGGRISCDSEPGRGTRMALRFPVPRA
jgi:signal transduction histidine kinase